jgi:sec-independent protein translocase protein TatA
MVGDIMQPTHLLFVLVVALLVLGPKRLPEVGRQLGNGLRDFRAAINGERPERHDEVAAPGDRVEHEPELGGQPSETQAQYEFDQSGSETVADQAEFAHTAPEDAVEQDVTPEGSASGTEHEFAYETSEPAEKRADPLS